LASLPVAAFTACDLVVRRILTRPLLRLCNPLVALAVAPPRPPGSYGAAGSALSAVLVLGPVRGVRWLDQLVDPG
jgi:hypothetical protein